ncbi:MAG: hypothetical protein NZ839_01465 [Endomicrobia bacterium]|nr:hypothetical protein [Endomicrobiia bacterium]MCX7716347.1 hypothetical protein [Endomicrobiia bacterium]
MKNFYLIFSILYLIFFCNDIIVAKDIECVNSPTPEVVDYSVGDISIRIYSFGGVIARFIFSPFNRVNFGGSLDIDKLIGNETPEVREPAFYFKWKVFDGTKYFPSVAVGYDNQGYNFISNRYIIPAKGLYLVFSNNILVNTLFVDFGVNLTKYKGSTNTLCFFSTRVKLEDIISVGMEFENINKKEIQQLNCKLGLVLAKYVYIDFIFINLEETITNIERQVRIHYLHKF